jgi:hypothetical protein
MDAPVHRTQQALRIDLPAMPAWVGELFGGAERERPEMRREGWVFRTTDRAFDRSRGDCIFR